MLADNYIFLYGGGGTGLDPVAYFGSPHAKDLTEVVSRTPQVPLAALIFG